MPKYFKYYSLFHCLLKTASNLRSLQGGLEGLDFEARSTALISINNIMWRKSLQILDIT